MRRKNKVKDINMPVGKLTRIDDFLPPPSELVFTDDTVKITILVSRSSIEFFKRQARAHGTKYQKMIRQVLDGYTSKYKAA